VAGENATGSLPVGETTSALGFVPSALSAPGSEEPSVGAELSGPGEPGNKDPTGGVEVTGWMGVGCIVESSTLPEHPCNSVTNKVELSVVATTRSTDDRRGETQ